MEVQFFSSYLHLFCGHLGYLLYCLNYWPQYGSAQSSGLLPCPSSTRSSGATAGLQSDSLEPSPSCINTTVPPPTTDPLQPHLPLIIGVPVGLTLAGIGVLACVLWLVCSAYFQSKSKYYTSGGGSHTMPRDSKGHSMPTKMTSQQASTHYETDPDAFTPHPEPVSSNTLKRDTAPSVENL